MLINARGKMLVRVTMRPIQRRRYCCSQFGSSPQVTQTKPGLLPRVCACVCVCERRVKMPRAAERDAALRRSEGEAKEKRESFSEQESQQTRREGAVQGQDGVYSQPPPSRLADTPGKQAPLTSVCFIVERRRNKTETGFYGRM